MIKVSMNGKDMGEVIIETYPNGETRLNLTDLIPNGLTIYSINWKYESDSDFTTLAFIADYIRTKSNNYNKILTELNILYMPYSRMDRSENNSVFTLKTACKLINNMEFDSVIVNEAHSSITSELLNNCRDLNISEILFGLAEKDIALSNDNIPLICFYPDKGAKERYSSVIKKGTYLYGKKVRDFDTGRIIDYDIVDKDIFDVMNNKEPFNVIIIDDLSSYGGTFVQASKKLKEIGANKVYLVVAHAEESVYKGELFDHIDKLYTTNSILKEALNDKTTVINLI